MTFEEAERALDNGALQTKIEGIWLTLHRASMTRRMHQDGEWKRIEVSLMGKYKAFDSVIYETEFAALNTEFLPYRIARVKAVA